MLLFCFQGAGRFPEASSAAAGAAVSGPAGSAQTRQPPLGSTPLETPLGTPLGRPPSGRPPSETPLEPLERDSVPPREPPAPVTCASGPLVPIVFDIETTGVHTWHTLTEIAAVSLTSGRKWETLVNIFPNVIEKDVEELTGIKTWQVHDRALPRIAAAGRQFIEFVEAECRFADTRH